MNRLYKNQNTLVILGTGVIIFGFWSVIRMMLYMAMRHENIYFFMTGEQPDGLFDIAVVYLVFFVVVISDIALRLYVGSCARAEGLSKKSGYLYIVLTFIMALANIIFDFSLNEDITLDILAGWLVDLTSIVTLIELGVAAIRVKTIKKKLTAENYAA